MKQSRTVFVDVILLGASIITVLAFVKGWRVKYKNGVLLLLAPEMARALPLIELAHQNALGNRQRIDDAGHSFVGAYITNAWVDKILNPTHEVANSLHFVGKAIDLRTIDLSFIERGELDSELTAALGVAYDVVSEPNEAHPAATPHIHIEYDPHHDGSGQ